MFPFFLACISFLGTFLLTPCVARGATLLGIVDRPTGSRKRHTGAIPLLGGVGIFFVVAVIYAALHHWSLFPPGLVPWHAVVGLLIGGSILMLGGVLDDRFTLPAWVQLLFTSSAVLVVIGFGISVTSIRSPFGGSIFLDQFHLWGFIFPGDLLTFLWILGVTYSTKVLDGLDGLVSGLTVIAMIFIIAIARRPELQQPDVAVLAAVAAGAYAGFLVWNTSPARIFLGEAGSTLAGFLIGTLAVISGTKVATTLLVLGVPILDLALVIISRLRERKPLAVGDLRHLHFRLLQSGVSPRAAVFLLYAAAIVFGCIGLVASTQGKMIAFLILAALVVLVSHFLDSSVAKKTP